MSSAPLRLVTTEERGVRLPPVAHQADRRIRSATARAARGPFGRRRRRGRRAGRQARDSFAEEVDQADRHRSRHLDGRSHDARGRRHSRQGELALHQSAAPDPLDVSVPSAAAVCVYPDLVAHARAALRGSSVKVASVATAFPSGRASLAVKLLDVRDAVVAGADEIDMVIDRGAFLSGRLGLVFDEVVAVKEACGDAHLKVILEAGELVTYDNVRRASWLAMLGGADFIKTSTGKVSVNSTLPTCLVMLEAVRDFAEMTGDLVGVKVAGGIRTTKDALALSRARQRDNGGRVAHARSLSHRRVVAPERSVHATREATPRRVPAP